MSVGFPPEFVFLQCPIGQTHLYQLNSRCSSAPILVVPRTTMNRPTVPTPSFAGAVGARNTNDNNGHHKSNSSNNNTYDNRQGALTGGRSAGKAADATPIANRIAGHPYGQPAPNDPRLLPRLTRPSIVVMGPKQSSPLLLQHRQQLHKPRQTLSLSPFGSVSSSRIPHRQEQQQPLPPPPPQQHPRQTARMSQQHLPPAAQAQAHRRHSYSQQYTNNSPTTTCAAVRAAKGLAAATVPPTTSARAAAPDRRTLSQTSERALQTTATTTTQATLSSAQMLSSLDRKGTKITAPKTIPSTTAITHITSAGNLVASMLQSILGSAKTPSSLKPSKSPAPLSANASEARSSPAAAANAVSDSADTDPTRITQTTSVCPTQVQHISHNLAQKHQHSSPSPNFGETSSALSDPKSATCTTESAVQFIKMKSRPKKNERCTTNNNNNNNIDINYNTDELAAPSPMSAKLLESISSIQSAKLKSSASSAPKTNSVSTTVAPLPTSPLIIAQPSTPRSSSPQKQTQNSLITDKTDQSDARQDLNKTSNSSGSLPTQNNDHQPSPPRKSDMIAPGRPAQSNMSQPKATNPTTPPSTKTTIVEGTPKIVSFNLPPPTDEETATDASHNKNSQTNGRSNPNTPGSPSKANQQASPSVGLPTGPFTWDLYLQISPAPVAPTAAFQQSINPIVNEFEKGMKLQAKDPRGHSNSWCLASVVHLEGLRLKLRFDGADTMNDFFELVNSENIRPVNSRSDILLPPVGFQGNIGNYSKYVEKILFKPNTKIASQEIFTPRPERPAKNLFKVGMKLEAVDRKNPAIISPASVTAVDGDSIRILFDGLNSYYEDSCPYYSRDIFPINWCRDTGYNLMAPTWHVLLNKSEPPKSRGIAAKANRSPMTPKLPAKPGPITKESHLAKVDLIPRSSQVTGSALKSKLKPDEPSTPQTTKRGRPRKRPMTPELSPKPQVGSTSSVSADSSPQIDDPEERASPIGFQCQRTVSYHEWKRTKMAESPTSKPGSVKTPTASEPETITTPRLVSAVNPQTRLETPPKSDESSTQAATTGHDSNGADSSTGGLFLSDQGGVNSDSDTKPLADTPAEFLDNYFKSSSNASCSFKNWSTRDVLNMIRCDETLTKYSQVFENHEIDGKAFVLLTTDVMIHHMGLKIGPVLKIRDLIERVKKFK